MNDEDRAYTRGRKAALRRIADQCLHELGDGLSDAEKRAARLLSERAEAVAVLRNLCEAFGDNDWDDSLELCDIIDKHLGRHLHGVDDPDRT